GPQSWDRGGVSNSGLVLVVDDAERPVQLAEEVALLVVDAGRAERGDGLQAVDGDLLAVLVLLLLDEVFLAGVVVAPGDLLVHPLDRLLLPRLRAGRAIERAARPQRVVGELDRRGALGTTPSQHVRSVRVSLEAGYRLAV